MKHIENEAAFTEALENPVLLVDFYADWCAPCRMLSPAIEKLAEEYEGKATVAKLNVDNVQAVAVRYGVMSIPAVILYQNGEPVETMVGLRPYEEIAAVLDKYV